MSEFTETYFKPRVKDFVSTVLLIDDQLTYSSQVTQPVSLVAPVAGMHSDASVQDDSIQRNVQIEELIAAFSAESLLVTPINPRMLKAINKDECVEILVKLAQKSDVVILDWEMIISFPQGNGIAANELANELLKKLDEDNKYRLVFIYTADSNENVETSISDTPQNIDVKIYGKTDTTASNAKTYPQLARQIYVDYLEKKRGLLGAALMGSLTSLRKSTFDMLSSLKEEYDEALLYHRILLAEPDKIKDFCNDLIEDEILGELSYSKADALFSADVMNAYAQEKNIQIEVKKPYSSSFVSLEVDEKTSLIKDGYKFFYSDKDMTRDLMKKFVKEEKLEIMKSFSFYTTTFNDNKEYITLSLGCIVKKGDNYYLCIQPPCDSVRLPKRDDGLPPKPFLFIKLNESADKSSFYIKSGRSAHPTSFVGLKIVYNEYITFPFKGNESGVVGLTDGMYFEIFNEENGSQERLEYICNLKPMFAQKIANEFAANVSRVGIDQFEWLRMKGS